MCPGNFKPKKDFSRRLDDAKSLPDIFEIVKAAVWECHKKSRGGLMLGLADLGNHPQEFFGAFYPVGSNVIVMNKIPLERIKETRIELWKPYTFHVLLHEYLHTLGFMGESIVRRMAYEITEHVFGEDHLATKIAENTSHFFHNLVYTDATWQPDDMKMVLVGDFDRGSTNYIA